MTDRSEQERELLERINRASRRINDIAAREAKEFERGGDEAAWGELYPEKQRIIESINRAIDAWEGLSG